MTAIDQAIDLYLNGSTVEEARGLTTPPITTYMFYKKLRERGIEPRGPISRREVIPVDSHLTCLNCGGTFPVAAYSKHPGTRSGYDNSRCKDCKKSKNKWENVPIEKRILNRTRSRSARKGIAFDLELEDIELPETCPVFNKEFVYGDHMRTYSIDRKDPKKGYTKGNIAIISNKANMIKSIATTEEIRQLYEWMKENDCP